ncbi:MAG: MFS transporter [Hyphomicrobiales bacterium]|nr:MFS transporter [Hyphomicrobiales bacterium]
MVDSNNSVPPSSKSVMWRSATALIASITASGASIGMIIPLLAVSMERMDISSTVIGLNSAMPPMASLLVTPFIPRLLPLIPARLFLPGCLCLSICCVLLYGIFPNVWFWFPLRFLNGIAIGGLFVVSEVWLNVIAEERWRGRLIGVYASFFALGFAIGPILFRFTGLDGFLPYLAICGVLSLAFPPLLLIPRESPKELLARPTMAMFRLLHIAPAALMAVFVFGMLEAKMLTLLSIYALRTGLDEYTSILTITVFAAGNVLWPLPIGMLADMIDRRVGLLLCALGGLASAVMLPFIIATPEIFFPLLFLFGGIVSGLYTVGLTLVGQRFRGANITAANALFLVLYSLGSLSGPIVGGVSMDIWNPHGLAVSMIVLSGAYALFLAWRMLSGR